MLDCTALIWQMLSVAHAMSRCKTSKKLLRRLIFHFPLFSLITKLRGKAKMRFSEGSQAFLEREIENERFSLRAVFKHLTVVEGSNEPLQYYASIQERLGDKVANDVLHGLLRAVFFIELVKEPKIETTKFALRWKDRLSEQSDPRYASYTECLLIFEKLIEDLDAALVDPANKTLLQTFVTHHLLPYEIPLDYRERPATERIHQASNLAWYWDELPRRVTGLRTFLLDPERNTDAPFFAAAYNKIKVKTYLTDRVLTGDYKTNREKRWEIHPRSVHFALRRVCWGIEYALIRQICHFDGFPSGLAEQLKEASLIEFSTTPFRCPITLEPLSFEAFKAEIAHPTHGKSAFQVGHLNPLKAIMTEEQSGHTAVNISWISFDGNRIQGALSLEETRRLIQRIAHNYHTQGLV